MSANRVLGSVGFLVFSLAQVAVGQVVVELIPDSPGPYAGGQAITVDVWLHGSLSLTEEARLDLIQFDFTQTNMNLSLAPTFFFDYSSAPGTFGYQEHPELLVPWTINPLECVCPELFLPLPPGGVLHIGSLGVRLPTTPGVYRMDALNAGHATPEVGIAGAIIYFHLSNPPQLTAFGGQITGGVFDFIIPPPIPTMSGAALLVFAVFLGCAGSWIAVRRLQRGPQHFPTIKTGTRINSYRGVTRGAGGPGGPSIAKRWVGSR